MSDTRLRVAINASFWGQETTGSGQYLHHLTAALVALDGAPEVVLCGAGAPQAAPALPSGATWRTVPASPWRRLGENVEKVWFEQVAFPRAARAGHRSRALLCLAPLPAPAHGGRNPRPIPLLLPGYRSSALVRSYLRLVAAEARRASLVLPDAEASVGDIVRHLGVPQERVRAIPLAVPPAYRPQGSEALAALRARYELPERYLLYLGGYDQRLNLAALPGAGRGPAARAALPALVM